MTAEREPAQPGTETPTTAEVKDTMAEDKPAPSQFDLPECDSLQSQSADAVAALFETKFPPQIIDPKTVDAVQLTPEEMEAVTAFAACAAAKNDFEPFIADNATALFTSRVHGKAAFAALDRISRRPGFIGPAAKAFAKQMRGFAEGPTE